MVGHVSSKFRNAGLVVVSVLRVELHVAVAEQKHQLHSKAEGYESTSQVKTLDNASNDVQRETENSNPTLE